MEKSAVEVQLLKTEHSLKNLNLTPLPLSDLQAFLGQKTEYRFIPYLKIYTVKK